MPWKLISITFSKYVYVASGIHHAHWMLGTNINKLGATLFEHHTLCKWDVYNLHWMLVIQKPPWSSNMGSELVKFHACTLAEQKPSWLSLTSSEDYTVPTCSLCGTWKNISSGILIFVLWAFLCVNRDVKVCMCMFPPPTTVQQTISRELH